MRKIYSLVLMAAALLVGTNAWAVTHTVSNDTELQDAWKAASNGDVIQLTASFALTKTLWLGTATMSDTPMSLTLDLNGNALQFSASSPSSKRIFYITHGELNVITSVPGGQIVYTGTPSSSNMTDSGYEIFRLTGSTYKTVNPETATSGYYSHLTIGEGVYVKAIANAITIDRLVSISGFSPISAGNIAIPANASGKYPGTSTNLKDGDKVPAALNTNIYRDDRGVANGVRIDIYGRIEANKYAVKSNGNLGSPSTDVDGNRQYLGFKADQNGTSYVVDEADVDYSPFIHIHSTAELKTVQYDSKKAVAAYSGGYARWLVEGSCIGSTGVYVKSGEIVLRDAVIASNYSGTDYTNAVGTNSGVQSGGSGIVMESSTVYAGDIDVTVQGDTKVSATSGYAIDEAVTATDGNTKVDAITIEGGTFESGGEGTMRVTETTIEAAADPDQETIITIIGGNAEGGADLGGQTLQEFLETQQGENAAYVTIVDDGNGGQTMVISQGEAPSATTEWSEIAEMTEGSDANWTGFTPGIIGDGTTVTKVTLGKLLINAGTLGNLQELTIKNNATLEVAHVVMNAYARITVEPGGKFIVKGTQGIVAPAVDNIILQASETAQAKFLFNPAVSSNRQPNATVQVYTYAKQNSASSYTWQRMVSPMASIANITHNGASAPLCPASAYNNFRWWTEVWDYEQGAWVNTTNNDDLGAFRCFQLTNNSANGGITYTFTGNIQGTVDNSLYFNGVGYNFFGNSYTAPMSLTEIATTLYAAPADIDHSIWLWDRSGRYVSVNSYLITNGMYTGSLEIPALHSFIMKQNGASINMDLNYTNTVWNYNMGITPNPVVARANNINAVRINITSSEGDEDYVFIAEDENLSADYDNGADASKLMQAGRINFYVMAENDNLSICGTDDIVGTLLSLETQNDINYTLTFTNVRGEVYALRDNMTNAVVMMNEGATYNFTSQPNATLDGRFQIVSRQEMPTSVETVEEITDAPKAIYTVMGQYVGETTDWNNLPAGVYVVDGVKVIK